MATPTPRRRPPPHPADPPLSLPPSHPAFRITFRPTAARVRLAGRWALGAGLLAYIAFVHAYMQRAEPFNPEPAIASAPALILGLPIAALVALILFAVVFAVLEVWDRA